MLSLFASALRCFAWNHELPSMQTAHDEYVLPRVPQKVLWSLLFAAWKCFKWAHAIPHHCCKLSTVCSLNHAGYVRS